MKETGPDGTVTYKGFIIDLLARVAQVANFEYTFYLVPDGYYGVKVNASHWNGLVGELQYKVILSHDVYMCRSLLNNECKTPGNPDTG